ncbi:MAG: ABC transporter permease [Phycisphaerae bacterium]|jgi:microcin C transport system permease protein|nr:ABC transporter permease [Phycisphaerae bacterium]
MFHYVLRRLLLMIPTLLGITFLIFLLLAMAPGGIGAGAVRAGGGSQVEGSKLAVIQAYFEDRYGIKDPVLVQYGRWLARIAPVKFGARDQSTPAGAMLSTPREVDAPPMLSWFPLSDATIEARDRAEAALGTVEPVSDAAREEAQRAYRRLETEYVTARGAYRAAIKLLGNELIDFAQTKGIAGVSTAEGDARFDRIERIARDPAAPQDASIQKLADEVHTRYVGALEVYRRVRIAFAAKPFPEAGIPIIPGWISLGAPDLGVSFSQGQPSSVLIGRALPVTMLLNFIAFPIIYLIAVPTGILAASRRGSWFDIGSGGLFVALWSVPVVWTGTLMIGYLASDQYLGAFPASGLSDAAAVRWTYLPSWRPDGNFEPGWLLDRIWHICLPVTCLVYGGFAILAKQTRAAMLDNFSADYVRTAIAKGVPRGTVTLRHVFRNSLLPIITMFVTIFPSMLAGSVIIERIFSVPGMGSLLLEAINARDRELILANTLMVAAVNLVALLLADILYAAADPRVTYE